MPPMKKIRENSRGGELKEMEASIKPETNFKSLRIRMLNKLRRVDYLTENFNREILSIKK